MNVGLVDWGTITAFPSQTSNYFKDQWKSYNRIWLLGWYKFNGAKLWPAEPIPIIIIFTKSCSINNKTQKKCLKANELRHQMPNQSIPTVPCQSNHVKNKLKVSKHITLTRHLLLERTGYNLNEIKSKLTLHHKRFDCHSSYNN